jgi:hypothetical protein
MNRLSCNLSLNENLDELEIYPNPAESYIQFEGLKAEDQVNITDLNGKELTFNTSGNRIDCSNWAPGIYLVHINRNGTSVTKRIAIK